MEKITRKLIRDGHSVEVEFKRIGWFHVNEETVFTRYYEVAAWYTNIEVQPGWYPVYQEKPGADFFVEMPGVIVGSDFTSLFCGNRVGSKVNEDVEKEDTYVLSGWDFQLKTRDEITLD